MVSTVPDRVSRAVTAIAAGRAVVVVDDEDREDEGDLIFAAECATPELMAFTVRHTSGYVCVALPGEECERLALPPMHHRDGDRFGTAYRVTVDLAGTGTGISASARARTVAALGSADTGPLDLVRPGHVVPLRAREGGVLTRPGHTEAAVDLARLAGLRPAGALCEIVSREHPGEMARGEELRRFAAEHGLEIVSIAELIAHRRRTEAQVERVAVTSLPTGRGGLRAIGYRGVRDGAEHLALVAGDLGGSGLPLHVHSECLLGDVFGGLACSCGAHLDAALADVSAAGRGIVVYTRSVGVRRACGLFPQAVAQAGPGPAEVAAAVAVDLGLTSVRTDDPLLRDTVRAYGLRVDEGTVAPQAEAG